jgi:hypothetical protein
MRVGRVGRSITHLHDREEREGPQEERPERLVGLILRADSREKLGFEWW